MSAHERMDHGEEVERGSDRSFGLVFAIVFALLGGWSMWHGGSFYPWSFGLAALFLIAALAHPTLLAPLNRLWFRLGMLLSLVVTPLVMGLIFVTTVLPIGLIMRLAGKRPLPLAFDRAAASYWIPRDPPGPEPESLRNQF